MPLRIEDVIRCHRQHTDQPDLIWLVETLVRGHEGPDHTHGLDQGSPYSPPSAELVLHTCLDRVLDETHPGHPPQYRYVDNLPYLCRDAHEGHQVLEDAKTILARHHMTLKEKELQDASRELKRLRDSIRDRLQQGATVERGSLRVWVKTSESRRFSQAVLASIIGERAMLDLRERLPTTMSHQLVVEQCFGPPTPEPPTLEPPTTEG